MRRAAKKDANHNEIGDGLRARQWSVLDLSRVGGGIPDMVIGRPGFACLVEVKNEDGKGTALTPAEQAVKNRWDGPYIKVVSLEDALAQLAAMGWT